MHNIWPFIQKNNSNSIFILEFTYKIAFCCDMKFKKNLKMIFLFMELAFCIDWPLGHFGLLLFFDVCLLFNWATAQLSSAQLKSNPVKQRPVTEQVLYKQNLLDFGVSIY